ncbi:transposon Ty3-I Gag-Pol polyprotein [Nephila pilipes]|uniref:Transposon Ty3-I Gag-Pol polyprotein n=1 Tax=Nephila pilipes TaxID=299642 RepID=A0A8X6PT83_NEPPI|nr:transposon Ty3-I Gag-Pol polyprotein [Nephila pilipes]
MAAVGHISSIDAENHADGCFITPGAPLNDLPPVDRETFPSPIYQQEIRTSKSKYLTDTGADVSVVPLTVASKHPPPASLQLFAANGAAISTYGQRPLTLDLGLRRVFRWPFIIAAVSQPMIGADFLRHYGLLVDNRRESLVDPLTKLQTQGAVE